ncbi:MAG: hypothetical protein IJ206_12795 [Oscillospiraceae bacterium]|nr:hypothetical protein [Oscillospiraceae bacterium]
MKKWILCLTAFLTLDLLDMWPFEQEDTSTLYIVESLQVETGRETVTFRTGGIEGTGADSASAIERLDDKVPGKLFLRQARRVIFLKDAERYLDLSELPDQLPAGAYVYRAAEEPENLEELEPVLTAKEQRRKDIPTLAQMKNGTLSGKPVEPAKLEADHADS